MTIAVVTGGAGFLGAATVRALERAGEEWQRLDALGEEGQGTRIVRGDRDPRRDGLIDRIT